MPQNKSKKILLYFFLFLIIGTLNNKNLNNPNLSKISKINVEGLSEVKNTEVINSLNFLKINNLFFLDKIKVQKTLNSNNLIQKYTVYKKYPSTLNIKIEKTKFLAQIKNDLSSEISEGKAEVFRDGDNIVIRLAEQGSFVSGKADLQAGFMPLLEKVGKTISTGEGNVKIEGHTDNVPVVENPRFKSNWDLSGARAGAVPRGRWM